MTGLLTCKFCHNPLVQNKDCTKQYCNASCNRHYKRQEALRLHPPQPVRCQHCNVLFMPDVGQRKYHKQCSVIAKKQQIDQYHLEHPEAPAQSVVAVRAKLAITEHNRVAALHRAVFMDVEGSDYLI